MRSPALAAALALAGVAAAVQWSTLPASPVSADAPAIAFSEERAWPVVTTLVDEIGHRTAGTDGATQALTFLTDTMRAIPGLEVEVQDVTDFAIGPYTGPSIFRVRNVVARLPGEIPDAVLVAAHYDSARNSVGAADDALGVAAVVEAARALAAGPKPYRSVVFLLDEGEELGLFGAQGFLRHRWANDVVTFLNLEAAGARGRPILFQTGPGDPWLASAYAASAPHPHGSVLGQDIFQSGVIPSDTDFRVYRDDAGLRGLDLALYRDGWAYHTHLDRTDRLQPGSLQEMGDNTLGVVRALANDELPSGHIDSPAVYYDVLGLFMIAYAQPVAWGLALGAIVLLVLTLRRGAWRGADLLRGTGWAASALFFGALCGVVAGWLIGPVLGRGMGWYARPWLALAAFAPPAMLGTAGVLRLGLVSARTSLDAAVSALLGGVGVVFAGLLVLATWYGLGSAYLALWWVVGTSVALRLAAGGPRRYAAACALGFVIPAVLTMQAADSVVATFIPMSGRLGVTMDPIVAALVAVPAAALALLPGVLVTAYPPAHMRRIVGTVALVCVAAGIALAVAMPYSAERPKRIGLQVVQQGNLEDAILRSFDAIDVDDARARVVNPLKGVELVAGLPAARLTLVADERGGSDGGSDTQAPRRVTLRLEPEGATAVRIDWALAHWRLVVGENRIDRPGIEGDMAFVTMVVPPAEGVDLVFESHAKESLRVEVRTFHSTLPAAALARCTSLPEWVSLDADAWVISEEEF